MPILDYKFYCHEVKKHDQDDLTKAITNRALALFPNGSVMSKSEGETMVYHVDSALRSGVDLSSLFQTCLALELQIEQCAKDAGGLYFNASRTLR